MVMSPTVYANESEAILDSLAQYISKERLEELAKKHSLVKRKRVFDTTNKIKFLFASSQGEYYSYSDSVAYIKQCSGKSISPQAISKVFDENTANFSEDLVKSILKCFVIKAIPCKLFSPFNGIYIQDSTSFQLPKKLAAHYKGCKGDDTGSTAKVQLCYEQMSGKIDLLELTDSSKSDAKYACPIDIKQGALYLRDLGYWGAAGLAAISKAGAYFISRLHSNVNLYKGKEKTAEKIDIAQVINDFMADEKGGERLDLEVFVGKSRLAVRMLICRMPEGTSEKRTQRRTKKHGKKAISSRQSAMQRVNIFVTNIPTEMANSEWIDFAYRLRWSIEIVFKIWKSCFDLAKLPQQMNVHRFRTCFWLKMVHILVTHQMTEMAVGQSVVDAAVSKKARNSELAIKTKETGKKAKSNTKTKQKCLFVFSRRKCTELIQSFFETQKSLIDFFSLSSKMRYNETKKLFEVLQIAASIRGTSKNKSSTQKHQNRLNISPQIA